MGMKTCKSIEKYLCKASGKRVSVVKTSGDKIVFNYILNGELVTLYSTRYYVDFEPEEFSGILDQLAGNMVLYPKYEIVKSLDNRHGYYFVIENLDDGLVHCLCYRQYNNYLADKLEKLDWKLLYNDIIPPQVQAMLPIVQQKY